ncbi:MAG: YfiR family protein [Alphaproteobacteria bacterium]|nr:YfiR family protein [Alphaproteobacteria bacterium]
MAIGKQHKRAVKAVAASLRRLAIVGLAGGMIAIAVAPMVQAQSASVASADTAEPASISREYLIKAAILYNFAKFASWPAAAFSNDTAPLRICVIGADPFGPALESLNGKTVRNRALVTASIAKIEDAAACHILFVSASEKGWLGAILDTVSALPILTVADINQFANSGGIIALKEVDDRSRIEVNIGAANLAGLKLSSKLLRLADTVGTQTARTPVSTK